MIGKTGRPGTKYHWLVLPGESGIEKFRFCDGCERFLWNPVTYWIDFQACGFAPRKPRHPKPRQHQVLIAGVNRLPAGAFRRSLAGGVGPAQLRIKFLLALIKVRRLAVGVAGGLLNRLRFWLRRGPVAVV